MIVRKIHSTFFEVVNTLLVKRMAASSPRSAAVQWPKSMKWAEMKSAETTRQATIFFLSLNWKEIMSVQMATPIRICDKTKLESKGVPVLNC